MYIKYVNLRQICLSRLPACLLKLHIILVRSDYDAYSGDRLHAIDIPEVGCLVQLGRD